MVFHNLKAQTQINCTHQPTESDFSSDQKIFLTLLENFFKVLQVCSAENQDFHIVNCCFSLAQFWCVTSLTTNFTVHAKHCCQLF